MMRFFYVRLLTYAQCASMNDFTCSEHSVRIRRSKKTSTGNNPKTKGKIASCEKTRVDHNLHGNS